SPRRVAQAAPGDEKRKPMKEVEIATSTDPANPIQADPSRRARKRPEVFPGEAYEPGEFPVLRTKDRTEAHHILHRSLLSDAYCVCICAERELWEGRGNEGHPLLVLC